MINGVDATTSSSSVNFNEVQIQTKQLNREITPLYSTVSLNNEYNSRSKAATSKSSISGRLANMPRFYWPEGKAPNCVENEAILDRIRKHFNTIPGGRLQLKDFDEVCRRMNFAVYSKRAVFDACCRLNDLSNKDTYFNDAGIYSENANDLSITFSHFIVYWNKSVFLLKMYFQNQTKKEITKIKKLQIIKKIFS